MDKDGIILEVSHSVIDILGYCENEIITVDCCASTIYDSRGNEECIVVFQLFSSIMLTKVYIA